MHRRQGAEPQPRRILVVDDEPDAGETLAALLEARGHQTLAVTDGRAALAAARTFAPEVVLLDLGLPEMDGYQAAKQLRREHGDASMLVIAVTGYHNDAARLQDAGFDEHLLKPPDLQQLSSILVGWGRRRP